MDERERDWKEERRLEEEEQEEDDEGRDCLSIAEVVLEIMMDWKFESNRRRKERY